MKLVTISRTVLSAVTVLALLGAATQSTAGSSTPPVPRSYDVPPVAQSSVRVLTNLILNGDFENSTFTPGCNFNQSNASITAGLANITAYGAATEIDEMSNGTSCGFAGPPQSGTVKLAIHRQSVGGSTDEFSFLLSSAVVAGTAYDISFYSWSDLSFDPDVGWVEIGLSSSAASFGTLAFSGTSGTTGWVLSSGTFTAPVNATYLTARVTASAEAWIHIDNFTLELATVPVEDLTWGGIKEMYK
ncbi:MAG: hypothetical protein O7D32_03065 [bacterium]|nr:hypothetical protein [bacterium]